MGKLTIELPDDVIAAARTQLGDGLEQFLHDAIDAALHPTIADDELTALLDEASSSTSRPLTEADLNDWLKIVDDAGRKAP